MKQKTLEYVSTIESACAIARSLPICCSTASPEWPFVRDLWKARDRFIENLTAGLPEYEIPATASLLRYSASVKTSGSVKSTQQTSRRLSGKR